MSARHFQSGKAHLQPRAEPKVDGAVYPPCLGQQVPPEGCALSADGQTGPAIALAHPQRLHKRATVRTAHHHPLASSPAILPGPGWQCDAELPAQTITENNRIAWPDLACILGHLVPNWQPIMEPHFSNEQSTAAGEKLCEGHFGGPPSFEHGADQASDAAGNASAAVSCKREMAGSSGDE
jgi:hypothetical protein